MKEKPGENKGKYTQNLRLIGTIIAILFWWYDAYVDTYILMDGELIDNILRPDVKDVWMRFTVIGSLIGLSFYSHKLIDRVKRAETLKDHFVSTVSHELRTPLTSIIGSLDIIKSGMAGEISDESKKIVGIAHKNSNRLLDLINDILDLQKLESGLMTYQIKPMPVAPFVEDVVEAMAGFAEQYNVTVKAVNEVPDAVVQGDWQRLTQVLTNLAANAIRHSPAGKEVTINISQAGTVVRIAVIDHGPGVPQEFKSRIFSQFAQAESDGEYGKGGTGLGLSISKQIIERHEGKISFISDPGVTTSFYFDLPEFTGALPAKALAEKNDLDEATGVFNWAYLEKELEKEWVRAERTKISLALILIEVEGLETYFDEAGELAGNKSLRKIAGIISGIIKRPGDLLARYTSDRFIALLPDTDPKGAVVLMKKMRLMLAESDLDGLVSLTIHVVGEAEVPKRSVKSEKLLERLKTALVEAKK